MVWEITDQQSSGESHALNWNDAIADVAEMLDKALDACLAMHSSTLYLEMWPDSGRLICYPANYPTNGIPEERDSRFSVQVILPFWRSTWFNISHESIGSSNEYSKLKETALTTISNAIRDLASKRLEVCNISVIAFEYEGTEGMVMVGKDGMYQLR